MRSDVNDKDFKMYFHPHSKSLQASINSKFHILLKKKIQI